MWLDSVLGMEGQGLRPGPTQSLICTRDSSPLGSIDLAFTCLSGPYVYGEGRCAFGWRGLPLRKRSAVFSAPHRVVRFHSLSSSLSKTRGWCHATFIHLVGVVGLPKKMGTRLLSDIAVASLRTCRICCRAACGGSLLISPERHDSPVRTGSAALAVVHRCAATLAAPFAGRRVLLRSCLF